MWNVAGGDFDHSLSVKGVVENVINNVTLKHCSPSR